MKKITLLLLLVGLCGHAQDSLFIKNERNGWQTFTYDIGNIFGGVGYAYSRPLHWKGPQFRNLGLIAAGTGGLYLVDDEARDFFSKQEDKAPQIIRDFGWYFGSPQNNYGVTGGIYLVGLFSKNEKLRRTGVLLMSAATATGFLQQLSKSLVGRARPETDLGKNFFKPFGGGSGYRSFPSGHAVLGFTFAYGLGKQFKSPWVKAGLYAIGITPGVSRLWNEQHWLTDITTGVVMSILIVESIDKYLDRKYDEKYNNNEKKLNWNLSLAPNQIGVNITF